MRCAWDSLLGILPPWMRSDVNKLGNNDLQELRLSINQQPQLWKRSGRQVLNRLITAEDIHFCINVASRYSPWATTTMAQGYLSAPGGHRIGLCGEAVCKHGQVETVRSVGSLCIRVARDFPGIGNGVPNSGSILILGAPGWGKTTLLRDLIRNRSNAGIRTAVVDERGELFPADVFSSGQCTDILTGCIKYQGIYMLLRAMGPMCIAVDEITQPEDCTALIQAAGCGVTLLATAHATSVQDLMQRPVYKALLDARIFQQVLILRQDKSWQMERIQYDF